MYRNEQRELTRREFSLVRFSLVIVTLAAIAVALVHIRQAETRAHHAVHRLQMEQIHLRRRLYDQQAILGRLTAPREVRRLLAQRGWARVVAFQTRNPPHRAHEYIQKCALEICDGLFINPVIGKKKSGDFTDDVILKAYQTLIDDFYPPDRVVMSILPWQMRYAGPKEAIFHAIVRKNFGCTHHIIGRDHAGVGDYYDTYAAHRIFADFPDLGIQPLFFEHSFYCQACENMATAKTCPHDKSSWLSPSGTKIRAIITEGVQVAPEITRSEIAKVLASEERPFVE